MSAVTSERPSGAITPSPVPPFTAYNSSACPLLFTDFDPKTGPDIWMLPLIGKHTPRPLVAAEFNEGSPRVSPDGHWLAYVSNESGRNELYVRPQPASEPQLVVVVNALSELRDRAAKGRR